MHVLFITSWYPTENKPGAGIFFKEQAEALYRFGVQVGVIACTPLSLQRDFWKVPFTRASYFKNIENNIPVYRLQYWNSLTLFPSLYLSYIESIGAPAFSEYCEEYGVPDVIHAQSLLYGGGLAIRLKHRTGIPVVLQEHLTKFILRQIGVHQKKMVKRVASSVNKMYAVSERLAQSMQENYKINPVNVIGNSVDADFFSPQEKQNGSSPFVFTSIGGLLPRKGFDILLKAFQKISMDRDVRLQIAGAGPELLKLKSLAEALGISNKVIFLGHLSRKDTRDLIAGSHVVVSASHVETFAMTLIEAMACGVPVVATRSGGPEGFVIPDTGILCAPGDLDELGSALQNIIKDYQNYSPQKIRQYCIANFSEQVIAAKWVDVYTQLMDLSWVSDGAGKRA